MAREQRKLAAILAADVVGYSRLMGRDESGTLARLREHRKERLEPALARHGGRLVKLTGDGALVEFASAVDVLSAAIEVQQAVSDTNQAGPEAERIVFRIGLHLGDLIVDDDDLYGDGVNIAARLEAEAPPGGIVISGSIYEATIGRHKATFEDLGRLALKNIERPVQAFSVKWEPTDWKMPAAGPAAPSMGPARLTAEVPLALPDKPSIAVLPFTNFSSDPEQEYFADGMVEEIITALSRIRWLFVIARNSSFTYKGRAVDLKQVGRDLGVRYVLEGSVRKGGGRVRITVQLLEAENGTHLWADRFDGSLEEVFEIQDNIASSVAGIIEPTLETAEIKRSAERPTGDLTAYDFYLRALPYVGTYEWDPTKQALVLLRQAFERDPNFANALVRAAYCHAVLDAIGKVEDPEANRQIALDLARRALRTAGDDATALAHIAHVLGYFNEDIQSALAIVDRSLAVNPNSFWGWRFSGFLRLYNGEPEIAITHFEKSLRLSPRGPRWVQNTGIGIGHMFCERLETAASFLQVALQENPVYPSAHRALACCYVHLGKLNEARQVVARLRAITPVIVPKVSYYRDPVQREMFLSGLRLAAATTE